MFIDLTPSSGPNNWSVWGNGGFLCGLTPSATIAVKFVRLFRVDMCLVSWAILPLPILRARTACCRVRETQHQGNQSCLLLCPQIVQKMLTDSSRMNRRLPGSRRRWCEAAGCGCWWKSNGWSLAAAKRRIKNMKLLHELSRIFSQPCKEATQLGLRSFQGRTCRWHLWQLFRHFPTWHFVELINWNLHKTRMTTADQDTG